MNLIEIERHIKNKYGLLSIKNERKQEIIDLISDKFNWKDILDEFILNNDIREYFIGESIDLSKKSDFICNNLLVMVVKSYDCTRSKRYLSNQFENETNNDDIFDQDFTKNSNNQDQEFNNRLYHLILTTGGSDSLNNKNNTIINALEYERINSLNNYLLPGTKLILNSNNNTIQVQNSFLLLKNNNVKLIGGNVIDMVESWKLNNILNEYRSKNFALSKNLTKKPPKFIPYIDKESEQKELNNKVKDAQNNYKQFKEKQLKDNNKDLNREYDDELLIDNKAYNELINNITKYKRQNLNSGLISLNKFNKSDVNVDKKDNLKNNKKLIEDNRDPGAPIKYNKMKYERIDSEAQRFLKNNKTDILLFDHLFSKLGISDDKIEKQDVNNSNKKDEFVHKKASRIGNKNNKEMKIKSNNSNKEVKESQKKKVSDMKMKKRNNPNINK